MSNFTFAFSLFGNRYYFTPKFTLLSILLIALLFSLGFWQLNKAKTMQETEQLLNSRFSLDPVQLSDVDKNERDLRFYSIQLEGTFDNDHQILLSHRLHKGQFGYEVLTPFKPNDSSSEFLVNRGWIPVNSDPNQLPDIQITSNPVSITGVLFKPLNYFVFGAVLDEKNVKWPLLSKRANLEKLSNALNTPLYPYLILLSSSSPYGYVREWTWLYNSLTPDRNKALAHQWFALAIVVLLIFLFINIERV